jgi:hypothetical protein
MKVSVFAFIMLVASASIWSASAYQQCTGRACQDNLKTGTALEIAQQYSSGGKFGGVSTGTTGSVLDVARSSIDSFGAPEAFASVWRAPPVVARGD